MKIIQETGYEGNIYNNFQVLNFHEKSGNYYTRINICGVYKIARMPLQDIINNIVPDKFPGKLVGNPYLHLDYTIGLGVCQDFFSLFSKFFLSLGFGFVPLPPWHYYNTTSPP